jgi:hypothetical protein
MSFKRWLFEQAETKRLPFDKSKRRGWWREGDHYILYHGTHDRNVQSMMKSGINRPDPSTGMYSTTPDPHTAHGYAAMSGGGGEAHFRGVGAKATTTPHSERSVLKLKIPADWAERNMDADLRGNMGDARRRMLSRGEYVKWVAGNPDKDDSEYYMATEVRFKKPIPPEFIEGHMKKMDQQAQKR